MVAIVTPRIDPLTIPTPAAGLSGVFTWFNLVRFSLFAVILLGLLLSVGG